MNYLKKISKNDLDEFISICKSVNLKFDEDKFRNVVANTIKHIKGNKKARAQSLELQELEKQWYASLETNVPDFSVYDNIYYLADAWVCWKLFSREYLKLMTSNKTMSIKNKYNNNIVKNMSIVNYMGKINKVADLGCGIGYTCVALKEMFDCEVYGTNILETSQYKVCDAVAKKEGYNLVYSLEEIGHVDLVFASEYFEHFEKPIEHLIEVIETCKPKYIVFANTFNSKSIGHFDKYIHGTTIMDGMTTAKSFSQELKKRNYNRVKTNCYNGRPKVYEYGQYELF